MKVFRICGTAFASKVVLLSNKFMYKRLIAFLMFLSLIVLLAIMQTTAPSKVGPVAIVFVFILIYVLVTCTLSLLFLFLRRAVILFRLVQATPSQHARIIAYCAVLALAPTIILAMQSVGQMQPYIYVCVGLFVVLAISYIHYQMCAK